MNPFLLFSIALTAIFGAWQSTIITSYSLNLLTEPIPPTPFPSTLQLITNITGNLSTSLFVPPYLLCPLINPWNLDIGSDGTGVFPEDRRSVDTLPMTNKGDDDLQGPTSGLEKELEVAFCPITIMGFPPLLPTSHPNSSGFTFITDKAPKLAKLELASLAIPHETTICPAVTAKLHLDIPVCTLTHPDITSFDITKTERQPPTELETSSPAMPPGAALCLVIIVELHRDMRICTLDHLDSTTVANNMDEQESPVSFEVRSSVIPRLELPVCSMGESRNLTCDAVQDLGSAFSFDDNPDIDDPQDTAASGPDPSPTRSQTLWCLAGLLGMLWHVATQWLPQQGVSKLASLYDAEGLVMFHDLTPRRRADILTKSDYYLSVFIDNCNTSTWTLDLRYPVDNLPDPKREPKMSEEERVAEQIAEQVAKNQDLKNLLLEMKLAQTKEAEDHSKEIERLNSLVAEEESRISEGRKTVTKLRTDYDALIQTRTTSEENHRKEIADAQGRIDEANQLHQSELASRELASTLVESNLEQALASNRGTLYLESSRLQGVIAKTGVLSQRNAELVAQVTNLEQLIGEQVKVSSPPAIPSTAIPPAVIASTAVTSLPPVSEPEEAPIPQPGPSRPNPSQSRPGENSRALLTGIRIRGAASEGMAQRQSSISYSQWRATATPGLSLEGFTQWMAKASRS